jgi:hypothetical protein
MVVAFGADFPVGFEIFLPDDGAATAAFDPHAFGNNPAFADGRGILDWFFLALKPSHG